MLTIFDFIPLAIGAVLGWLIVQAWVFFFAKRYVCPRCGNVNKQLTEFDYRRGGGFHVDCPPFDIGMDK